MMEKKYTSQIGEKKCAILDKTIKLKKNYSVNVNKKFELMICASQARSEL